MATVPANQGSSTGPANSFVPRVGHVYLDVRHRLLHYLNVRAKQIHKEGVPFLPSDLARCPVQSISGEAVKGDELPLVRAWKEERPDEVIFIMPRSGGPGQHITWNTAPMRNRKGLIVGVFGSVSLSQPEPDWQSLAGLAHDFRTPLQALKLLIALLPDSGPLNEQQRKLFDQIRAASDRALNIGLDLLEWCRGPVQGGRRTQATWFALEPFLGDVLSEQSAASQQKSLKLFADLGAIRNWEINADCVRLGRLLSNLLVNAIRYTTSGSVQFRAEWREDNNGRTLALGVVDTGQGFSTEEQESIFQPFERGQAGKDSDSGGSGLGLAVVDRLVEELGLQLDVYSEFGRGSEFHLLVPMRMLRQVETSPETLISQNETQMNDE